MKTNWRLQKYYLFYRVVFLFYYWVKSIVYGSGSMLFKKPLIGCFLHPASKSTLILGSPGFSIQAAIIAQWLSMISIPMIYVEYIEYIKNKRYNLLYNTLLLVKSVGIRTCADDYCRDLWLFTPLQYSFTPWSLILLLKGLSCSFTIMILHFFSSYITSCINLFYLQSSLSYALITPHRIFCIILFLFKVPWFIMKLSFLAFQHRSFDCSYKEPLLFLVFRQTDKMIKETFANNPKSHKCSLSFAFIF